MSDVAPHAGDDLSADAVEVLRCFAALDIPDLTIELASAAADIDGPQVESIVDGLLQDGLLTSLRPGWFRLAPTARASVHTSGATFADDAHRRSRFVVHLLSTIEVPTALADATRWVDQHRLPVLAAMAMGSAGVAFESIEQLAVRLWQLTVASARLRADADWRAELSERAADAAIQARRPHALAELLQASAQSASQEGDYLVAEAQWVRAIAIWRELNDQARTSTAIAALGAVYRLWGRWHRALDADFDLVSEYQQRGDADGVARALHQVGRTMLLAGRPDSALDHLARAERVFADLASPAPGAHAEVLLDQGRAYWQQGMAGRARRCFSAALALCVDVDDTIAQRARRLLSSPDDQPLPSEQ